MTPSWPLHSVLGPVAIEPENVDAVAGLIREAMHARENSGEEAAMAKA
jgi:hypothetical protein